MPLLQIFRSRTKVSLPLLRRSIRVQPHYITPHPRCFATAPSQTESPTTIPPPAQVSETSTTTATQSESRDPLRIRRVAVVPNDADSPRLPPQIRRVAGRPKAEGNISHETRIVNIYQTVDQGHRIIRISRLMEICRTPSVIPGDSIIVRKYSLNPNNIVKQKSFVITHVILAEERRWVEFCKDDNEISPIMRKLEIEDIESDLSRYMVANRDLVRLNIGLSEPCKEDMESMTAIEYYFPRRIEDNIDIINRGLKMSHLILESNFGELNSFSMVGAIEHTLEQIKLLNNEAKRSFNTLYNRIFHPPGSALAGKFYRSTINTFDKSFLYAKSILNNPLEEELVPIPTPYEELRKIPVHEALAHYVGLAGTALMKLDGVIDLYLGKEYDKAEAFLRGIQGVEKRIRINIDAIKASAGIGYVGIQSMDGKRFVKKINAFDVVTKQVDRNLRGLDAILSLYPKSEELTRKQQRLISREVKFAPNTSIAPNLPPTPPPASTFLHSTSFSSGPTLGNTIEAKREYSTSSTTKHSRGGRVLNEPGMSINRTFGYRGKGTPRKNAFGNEIFVHENKISITPKPAPGESVREKMLAKEAERLKSMQGLGYSLMSGDHIDGGATVLNMVEKDTNRSASMWEGGGDMGELTDESGLVPLKKGDMCELRLGAGSILAIYLRPSPHGQPTADFLTLSGEVTMLPPTRISFFVPSFISEESTTSIINHYDKIYESSGLSADQISEVVLPRSEMVGILDKVRVFSKESSKLYAREKTRFEGLYERFALEKEDTELTLFEATEEIFGAKHDAVELYTTHLALMGDGVRYMADRATHRATSIFRVRSKGEVRMIEFVTEKIRTSTKQDDSSLRKKGRPQLPQVNIFQEFVKKARYLIDLSRENHKKDLTASSSGVTRVEVGDVVWDKNDMLFIDYIKASILQSGSQAVPMDGLVPVILRAMERYDGELDPITAYKFCTEIGVWGQWENLALRQKNVSFPGLGTSKVADEDQEHFGRINSAKAVVKMELVDSLKHIRKDWGNMEVFCIDDASAHEIDDGISLERVNENENWVHVHIANPTAWLPSSHWLSDLAFRRKQSLYLPDQVFPMLPSPLTNILGLGPNRGVMTMSTKISKDGEILDINIQPGFVRNVKRYTYDTVSKALGHHKAKPLIIQVGTIPEPTYKSTEAKLTPKQIVDLKTLSDIAISFRKARVKNNMIYISSPSFSVDVYTGLKALAHPVESHHPNLYRGYPSIKITIDGGDHGREIRSANFLVSELMQLANSVAAKFCGTKNIAAPFRAMEYDYERKDLFASFKNRILPSRDEFGSVSVESGLKYAMLIGKTRINPSPQPHRLMGLDEGYLRATSPLRRYSDMIAHWQIQSYLLGKEPRTHMQLSPFVSEMDRGERLTGFTMKESSRFWATVAIRRILELGGEGLPQNMTFLVMDKLPYPSLSTGLVLELGMAGKVKFMGKKDAMTVDAGDIVRIEPLSAMPGEKFVWFEFKGIVKKSEDVV